MKRYLTLLMLAAIGLGMLLAAAPASAAPRTRCFAETGHCISGPILAYWERNGGLPVFGYPITQQYIETVEWWTGPVQWFERDRLEDHGAEGVLAGRLGAFLLEDQGRPWETFPQVAAAPRGCRFFPETGHSLCGAFLLYWQTNGGLARFGYPLTEPIREQIEGWYGTVQYFERRRMEHHVENAGTKYEVLLGLLGRAAYVLHSCYDGPWILQPTIAAYRNTLCANWHRVPMCRWRFSSSSVARCCGVKGETPSAPGTIYVVFYDNARGSLVWQSFVDNWREGDPVSSGEKAPAGLYAPIRGFGKVWHENPQVFNTLGWGVSPEYADFGIIQPFRHSTQMIYRGATDRVFILYSDGHAEDIPRIL